MDAIDVIHLLRRTRNGKSLGKSSYERIASLLWQKAKKKYENLYIMAADARESQYLYIDDCLAKYATMENYKT